MLSYPYLKAYSPSGLPVGSLNLDGNGNNNPVAARDLSGKNTIKKTYFQGNISMKYKLPFVKGLSLKLNASYVKNYTMQKNTSCLMIWIVGISQLVLGVCRKDVLLVKLL